MSYQAADVYNATHDLALYQWVADLENRVKELESVVRLKAEERKAAEDRADQLERVLATLHAERTQGGSF